MAPSAIIDFKLYIPAKNIRYIKGIWRAHKTIGHQHFTVDHKNRTDCIELLKQQLSKC